MKNQDLIKEKELLENTKADLANFDQLYKYYVNDVYRFAFSLSGNQHDAEDITSQTFINFYKMINSFVWQGISLKFWFFKTVRNLCNEKFRLPVNENIDEQELSSDDYEVSFVDQMIQDDLLKQIQDEIKLLTPLEQEVINLRIWEGLSYVEIAKVQNSTEEASRKKFNRAISKIKNRLSKKGIQVAAVLPVLFTAIAKVGASSVYAAPASMQTFTALSITSTSMGTLGAIKTFLATKIGIAVLAGILIIAGSAAGTAAIVYRDKNADDESSNTSSTSVSSNSTLTSSSSSQSTQIQTKKVTTYYFLKDSQVWSMDIDTKEQKQITSETYDVLYFDVSRDGKYLAYTGLKKGCEGEANICYTGIALMDLGTKNTSIVYESQMSDSSDTKGATRTADRPISPIAISYDSKRVYFGQNNLNYYDIDNDKVSGLSHKPESIYYTTLEISPNGKYLYSTAQFMDDLHQTVFSIEENKSVYTKTIPIYPVTSFAGFAGEDEIYLLQPNKYTQPVNGQVPNDAGDSIEILNLKTNETRTVIAPNKQAITLTENNSDYGLLVNLFDLKVNSSNPSYFDGYNDVVKSILLRKGNIEIEKKFNYVACYSDENYILTYQNNKSYGSGYFDITRYVFGLKDSRNEELIKMINIYDYSCNKVEIRIVEVPQ